MFTGIVTDAGVVRRARERRGVLELEIEAPQIARELRRGDSVAVNGVCLTATDAARRRFVVEAMDETLVRTTLSNLGRGDRVNLELPLRLSDRLGGHLVQGHVDDKATVTRVVADEGMRRMWLDTSQDVLQHLAPKGSVALDGVSLTVVEVGMHTFQVALIPHTLSATTLGKLTQGDQVNVEVDVIAKYVRRFVERRS